MFERFTDRGLRVMQLANQEAQRFNHEYIGTEHLLLGLIKEGSGTACIVLNNANVSLTAVRLEVEKLVQSGPDMVTMGKLPHTPRAKQVIEYAMEEARNLNHHYVGTKHLLLALIREREGVASQVLARFGLTYDVTKARIISLLGAAAKGEQPTRFSVNLPQAQPQIFSCHEAATDFARNFSGKPLDTISIVDAFLAGAKWAAEKRPVQFVTTRPGQA